MKSMRQGMVSISSFTSSIFFTFHLISYSFISFFAHAGDVLVILDLGVDDSLVEAGVAREVFSEVILNRIELQISSIYYLYFDWLLLCGEIPDK